MAPMLVQSAIAQVFAATEPRSCNIGAGWSEARNSAPLQLRTMAEAFTHAAQSVDRLLSERPEKAADILERCYREYKEVKAEIDSILQLSRPGQAARSPPTLAIPIPLHSHAHGHVRSVSSQLSVSPHHHRRALHPNSGPTPPGSSASRSTKGSSASETILLIDNTDSDVEEHPVRMRIAAIEFSLIREDVAERITSIEPIEEDVHQVAVPNLANPGTSTKVRISTSMKLTWRRPKRDSTHRTTFYLVSRELLSIDVLLGYRDSGEGSPGVYTRSCCDSTKAFD